jgi:acid phosphatase (class A)
VDVARLAASACVARLHADEAFQQQLSKVKKELQKQKK